MIRRIVILVSLSVLLVCCYDDRAYWILSPDLDKKKAAVVAVADGEANLQELEYVCTDSRKLNPDFSHLASALSKRLLAETPNLTRGEMLARHSHVTPHGFDVSTVQVATGPLKGRTVYACDSNLSYINTPL